MGVALARLNERYLLGQSVESEIVDGKLLSDCSISHAFTGVYCGLSASLGGAKSSHRGCWVCSWYLRAEIKKLLMLRPGIDSVQSVQSQWIGPYTFAYKVGGTWPPATRLLYLFHCHKLTLASAVL